MNTTETVKVQLTAAKDISYGSGILTKDTQKAKGDVEEFSLAWLHEQRRLKDGHPEGSPDVVDAVCGPLVTEGSPAPVGIGDGESGEEAPDVDRGVVDGDSPDRGGRARRRSVPGQ